MNEGVSLGGSAVSLGCGIVSMTEERFEEVDILIDGTGDRYVLV